MEGLSHCATPRSHQTYGPGVYGEPRPCRPTVRQSRVRPPPVPGFPVRIFVRPQPTPSLRDYSKEINGVEYLRLTGVEGGGGGEGSWHLILCMEMLIEGPFTALLVCGYPFTAIQHIRAQIRSCHLLHRRTDDRPAAMHSVGCSKYRQWNSD